MSLVALRQAASNGGLIELKTADGLVTQSIKDAVKVTIGTQEFPLDETTAFYNDEQPQTLKAVVFAWLHDKSSIVDYRSECMENGVADFKFLAKTELSAWLSGKSDSCEFIKGSGQQQVPETGHGSSTDVDGGTKVTVANGGGAEEVAEASAGQKRKATFERDSIDHNAALRGSKNIEFGYLIHDAKKLIQQLKRGKTSGSNSEAHRKGSGAKKAKQPIIIVSPATTALLSLANIKEFLQNGNFVEPTSLKKPTDGIVSIQHRSERLSEAAQEIMVVDNVELFTKPEYWDRVVAIFTTGQAWQFAKYKYPQPQELFRKYPGFYLGFQGDITPKQIKDWNVHEIRVDRNKRFRDKMIVKDFWVTLEKILVSRGYGV